MENCNKNKVVKKKPRKKAKLKKHTAHRILNERLLAWLGRARSVGAEINGAIFAKTAREIYEELNAAVPFKASFHWVQTFEKRHSVKIIRQYDSIRKMIEETPSNIPDAFKTSSEDHTIEVKEENYCEEQREQINQSQSNVLNSLKDTGNILAENQIFNKNGLVSEVNVKTEDKEEDKPENNSDLGEVQIKTENELPDENQEEDPLSVGFTFINCSTIKTEDTNEDDPIFSGDKQQLVIIDPASLVEGSNNDEDNVREENRAPDEVLKIARTSKREYYSLLLKERLEIIKIRSAGTKVSEIKEKFDINLNTLNVIMENRDQIIEYAEKYPHLIDKNVINGEVPPLIECTKSIKRAPAMRELDRRLLSWLREWQSLGIPINGKLFQQKAQLISRDLGKSDTIIGYNWIHSFEKRFGVNIVNKPEKFNAAFNISTQLPKKTDKLNLSNNK